MVIGLGAPFIPFVTEDIFLRLFAAHETALSLHVSDWPTATPSCLDAAEEAQMQAVLQLLNAWRLVRSREKIFTRALSCITLQADPESQALLRGQEDTILAALRCDSFAFGEGTLETGNPDWRLAVELGEQPTDRVAAVDD